MGLSFFTHYAINQVDSGRFKTVEEAFKHCSDHGLKYGDLLGRLDEYPMHMHCRMLEDAGIKPQCLIYCRNIAAFDDRQRKANIAMYKEQIDTMEKLNIPLLMAAPSIGILKSADEIKRAQEYLIEGFAELVDYTKGSGVTVAMENQSVHARPDSYIKDIKYILDSVPGLMYILDSGNYWCVGEDVLEAYETFKDKTVNVHCKDWKIIPYGEFIRSNIPPFTGSPIGVGVLPLKELAKKLKENGYTGNVTLEINSPVTGEEFDNSIKFMRSEFGV